MVCGGFHVEAEAVTRRINRFAGHIRDQTPVSALEDVHLTGDERVGIEQEQQVVEPGDEQSLAIIGVEGTAARLHRMDVFPPYDE